MSSRQLLEFVQFALAAGAAALFSACGSTQRVAGPLWLDGEPHAREDGFGRTEVTVVRHSGPVDVRRPGAPAGYRLSYYDKRARLLPGGEVWVGPGGRAELVWEDEATSVVIFGAGVVRVGDPELDEALVTLEKVSRVQLQLTAEDRVVLPGGAELEGDPTRSSGPFLIEKRGPKLVRVRNQSKEEGRILYRDERVLLAPGDAVDLVVLAKGSAPFDPDPSWARTSVGAFVVETQGALEPLEEGGALRVRAAGPGELNAIGVHLRLETGDEVVLSGPGRRSRSSGSSGP